MDSFRARRHTFILALVAIGVSAGILSWSIVTIANLRSNTPGSRAASGAGTLAVPSIHEQANVAAKSDFAKAVPTIQPELLANRLSAAIVPAQANLKPSVWETDLDWLSTRPFPSPTQAEPQTPSWQTAAIPQSAIAPQSPTDPEDLVGTATTVARANHSLHVRKVEPAARGIAPKPHKVVAAQRSYREKIVEQGDSGAVSFRYRRRACAPPNMVDVCYMPAADRQRIVVERW